MLDLVIAFASGMVAAYAMGRPNVSGTLAGVAIAAALLPPLAVVGIGLTNDELVIAGNAAILFATNLVAIVLGAAVIFRLLGMHVAYGEDEESRWVWRAMMAFTLVAVILAAPLLLNVMEKKLEGPSRPALYPVSADVRNAVSEYLKGRPGLDLIEIARHSVEPSTGITLMIATDEPLKSGIKEELIQTVRTAREDESAIVRVFILMDAPTTAP